MNDFKRSGLVPVMHTVRPTRVIGVRQRGGAVIPTACPKCQAPAPAWSTDAEQGHCCLCGATWFRTEFTLRLGRVPKRWHAPRWIPMGTARV